MFKIASLQMVATGDLTNNLSTAQKLISQAAEQNCKMAVLPEYFCLFGKHDRDKLSIQESFGSGPIQETLSNTAQKNNIYIVAGTIPISTEDPNRVLNSTLVFSPNGQVICKYDKIHLFSFASGGESYDESKTLKPGKDLSTFEIEMFRAMGEVDCHLLPAAFTYTTGKVHWEILLRARAIENQCYFVASAQGGTHENGRQTWGHSMIINPWGHIQNLIESGEGLVIGELNHSELKDIRQKLPALKHRTHF